MTSHHRPALPPPFSRSLLAILGFWLGLCAASACSSSSPSNGGGCGAACASDQRCIDGACRPPCTDQSGCALGQNCIQYQFADNSSGSYCAVLAYAQHGGTGEYEACTSDDGCDTLRGFRCAGGQCQKACTSHFDCADFGLCEPTPDGLFCTRDRPATKGQYYASCPNGASDCDASAGYDCIGSGVGDLGAFCTHDCKSDDDCPTGFACGTVRVTPCSDACGVTGQATADCVQSSQIGAGKPYQCGAIGVLRHVCELRAFCSECESDADCLAAPGQICARDKSGSKICTVTCVSGVDSCPWGNAAECGVWDSDLGVETCSHRFGACRGSGQSCEPCLDDVDCPTGFCTRSNFTGERYCIDLSVSCDCAGDADATGTCRGHGCPTSPSGLSLVCTVPASDSDPFGNKCLGASTSSSIFSSPQSGCWP